MGAPPAAGVVVTIGVAVAVTVVPPVAVGDGVFVPPVCVAVRVGVVSVVGVRVGVVSVVGVRVGVVNVVGVRVGVATVAVGVVVV